MTMASRFHFVENCSIKKQLMLVLEKNFSNILEYRNDARLATANNRNDVVFFPEYKKNFNIELSQSEFIINCVLNTDGFIAKGISK